jgi:hypothetical protein
MRVPDQSVIRSVYDGELMYAEAQEELSWWETSDGAVLPQRRIRVVARRSWDGVEALIAPFPNP